MTDKVETVFSSLPVENFGIGEFVFVRGKLVLAEADAVRFRALLKTCDPITQTRVTEMPAESFERVATANLQPAASRANDSSTNLSPVRVEPGTKAIQAGGGENAGANAGV